MEEGLVRVTKNCMCYYHSATKMSQYFLNRMYKKHCKYKYNTTPLLCNKKRTLYSKIVLQLILLLYFSTSFWCLSLVLVWLVFPDSVSAMCGLKVLEWRYVLLCRRKHFFSFYTKNLSRKDDGYVFLLLWS